MQLQRRRKIPELEIRKIWGQEIFSSIVEIALRGIQQPKGSGALKGCL